MPTVMNPAANLYLVGPMGAGKTSIGRRLAEVFGMPFVDLDQVIEEHSGASITLTFEIEGEAGFRRRESRMLGELVQRRGIVLSTGGGCVLSPHNRELLRANGFVLWLDADVDSQLARLRHDRKRPLLGVDDRRARLEQLAVERNPLYAEVADLRMPSTGQGSSNALAFQVGLRLESQWRREPVEPTA
ncbi:MAG TPA: shikimate kinase [Dokdonella sp.]|uniref:shikimate kinase n=1 Tax=Dokdonella sp. TaxID=2291710 RepID=UPI0025BF4A3F|nr:shikimate kinase [Dokdonella sp.]HNR91409.1 shikimate kinase [Dokdonella sp.]